MEKIIKEALKEDIGSGDITSNLLIRDQKVKAVLLAKDNGVFCGRDIARQILKAYRIKNIFMVKDGQKIHWGQVLAKFNGRARNILKIERTLLNFLQQLSGVATLTSEFVQAVKPYQTRILDTRKTSPGLRILEKYAVVCGGGVNHRIGLYDMILVKDNHLKLVGSWRMAVGRLKQKPKNMKVEVEAENLQQVREILNAGGVDIILLDNMNIATLKKAIKYIRQASPRTLIEISGGITLKSVKQYAKLGVNRISIGALTHSAKALDISLEIIQ
ncbi:MAG: carboxylating nicotinate-nucleotide diphosphorylase [bacterium]|nr:carboxylating nicotinate-nucleotide diphosphorylase [bacterium]MDD5353626.1 carboxylating nicotinate-nucleotide diphosphorylase [bacterium]MDD5756506.1 carboxylating nicotinate-nucleotide diphosphorylase [bacterium]